MHYKYLVKQTDDKSKTVVIEYDDKTVENVSRSRVVRAPKRLTPAEIQNVVQPTVTNATFVDYPNTESVNQSHSPAAEKNDQRTVDEPNMGESQQSSEEDDTTSRKLSEAQLTTPDSSDDRNDNLDSDEFIIDSIVSHKINRSSRHDHAKQIETLFRVRWYGYPPSQDTWEPIAHLTRSHVVQYHARKRLGMPNNIDTTIADREATNKTPTGMAEQHVIGTILNHDNKKGNWTYLVRWYGQHPSADSWEPLSRLPRNKLIAYHKREQLKLPDEIDKAIIG